MCWVQYDAVEVRVAMDRTLELGEVRGEEMGC